MERGLRSEIPTTDERGRKLPLVGPLP